MSLKVIQDRLKKLPTQARYVIAVAAGKGGVGKSTIAVNLALALKNKGLKVGLLDADIYGPSLVQMLPIEREPVEAGSEVSGEDRVLPAMSFGMPYISVAHFQEKAQLVRAPIANQIIEQFLEVVEWGLLDYLVIDFPPGTGDIQLTLMQKGAISGALIVTTPQIVATLDVKKSIELFKQMCIPVLGVIENMSYFLDGSEKKFPFGKGGGEELSKLFSVPLLAKLPLDERISKACDEGSSLFDLANASELKTLFLQVANLVVERVNQVEDFNLEYELIDARNIQFKIENRTKTLPAEIIQSHCPCARCSKGKNVEKTVSFLEISPVGRYAIKCIFSSGCSRGIYPLKLLKQL